MQLSSFHCADRFSNVYQAPTDVRCTLRKQQQLQRSNSVSSSSSAIEAREPRHEKFIRILIFPENTFGQLGVRRLERYVSDVNGNFRKSTMTRLQNK